MDASSSRDPTQTELEVKKFSEVSKQVEDVCDTYIQKNFQGKKYDSKSAQTWANKGAEEIIKHCQEQVSSDYKFMCTLIVLQKAEAGFHMAASCFWETRNDGNFNKKYEFDEFYVICNFFGITRS